MLIGAYDQVTDEAIQHIQNDVSLIIIKIERGFNTNSLNDLKYENYKSNYETIAAEVESLQIRCNVLPEYKIILQQMNLLEANIHNLESLQKIGFQKKEELAPIRNAFESQFGAMIVLQQALKRKK